MFFKLLVFVIVIVVFVLARKATPAGNKSGTHFVEPANMHLETDKQKATLAVASFNIQTGKSNTGKRNIHASANALKAVDLAGIQEVYAPSLFNIMGWGKSQTHVLANCGGFNWLFCATRRRWLKEHRGNAVLSKLHVLSWKTHMLPDQSGKSFRNMTVVELEWQGQRFHFINTHLHTRQGRAEQLKVVLNEFANYPRAILVGDFNSVHTMPELKQALNNVEICDAINLAGIDTDNPDRIDWILIKGFKVEHGKKLEKGISDHPYYQVNLSYEV